MREQFTMGGIPIPPLPMRGARGETWPTEGPAPHISVVVAGNASAVLRHLDGSGAVHLFARRVVGGVPTGPTVNITTTGLPVTEGAGETLTFELTGVFQPHSGLVRGVGYLSVVANEAAGY